MSENKRTGRHHPDLTGQPIRRDFASYTSRTAPTHVGRNIDGFVPLKSSKTPQKMPATVEQKVSRTPSASKPARPRQAKSQVLVRQTVLPKVRKRTKRTIRLPRLSLVSTIVIGIILVGCTSVGYFAWKENNKPISQTDVLSSSIDNENDEGPDEDEITPELLAAYSVTSDSPRYIRIPRLSVNARIKTITATSNRTLRNPSNIYDAGWYDGSSKPREGGTTVINGHVHGATKPGIFYRLNNLKEGDTIEIERGDGRLFTYKVVAVESIDYDKIDMTKVLTSVEPGKTALNLLTYSDRFDIKTNKYEQRTIVYSILQ